MPADDDAAQSPSAAPGEKAAGGLMTPEEKVQYDKLEQLEHKFHGLQKGQLARRQFGCCGLLLSYVWDFFMCLPISSLLSACISIAGGMLVLAHKDDMLVAAQKLEIGHKGETAIFNLKFILLAVCAVNGLAVLAAFPATGEMRKRIFGDDHPQGWRLLLRWLAGPYVFGTLGIILAVIFVCVFGMSVSLLPAWTMLSITAGACKAGPTAQSGLAAAVVAISEWQPDADAFQDVVAERVDSLCAMGDVTVMASAAGRFCQGLGVMVIGQILQLSSHVAKMTDVSMQEDLTEEEDKEAVRHYMKRAAARPD